MTLMLVFFLFSKRATIHYLFAAIIASILYSTWPMLPRQFLYFDLTGFSFSVIILYTLSVIYFQREVNHFLLPVMYFATVIAMTVNNGTASFVPFYITYEIILLTGSTLISVKNGNRLPPNYLNLHAMMSALTGLALVLYTSAGSLYFEYLFFILLVFRAGLLPLWLMEKQLFSDSPLTFIAFYISRQLPVVILITKLDMFFSPESVSHLMDIIGLTAVVSLISGGILINNIKLSRRLLSSPVLIAFSILYLAISFGLDTEFIMLGIVSALFVSILSPRVYYYYRNKSKIVGFHLLDVDVYDFRYLVLLTVLFVFLLMIPFFPFIWLEFNLVQKAFAGQRYITVVLLLIGMFSYKITAVKVISRILSRRLYGKKVPD
ncbi:MAG: hypothetical protein JXA66_07800 [Oligoflexia bacterium]|nr:hypothetical protein [Oligoflexia bacterium]